MAGGHVVAGSNPVVPTDKANLHVELNVGQNKLLCQNCQG